MDISCTPKRSKDITTFNRTYGSFFTLIFIIENLRDYSCYGKYDNTPLKCLRRKFNERLRM